jgi:hypothetical protein
MGNSQQPPSVTYAAFDLAAFTSGLAHELANPLNALAMNAEVARLLIERNESERAKERLAALVADCARCGRLLQSIRRFGAGMAPGAAEPATVADLVAASCDQLRREGPVPAVEVHGGETELTVDRAAMSRALAELLRNAVEAGARNVRIVAGRDGGGCFVDLIDDGAGIPAPLRRRVMEPFFSTTKCCAPTAGRWRSAPASNAGPASGSPWPTKTPFLRKSVRRKQRLQRDAQFVHAVRLEQIGRGWPRTVFDLDLFDAGCRGTYQRHERMAALQFGDQVRAGYVAEEVIDDRGRERSLADDARCLRVIFGDDGFIPHVLEEIAQRQLQAAIVLDEKNSLLVHRHSRTA